MVCPLDWGLGHATRCVPVINALLARNAEVILAGEGQVLEFLKLNFPGQTFIHFPGTRIRYPSGRGMAAKMLVQLPAIIHGIGREHRLLRQMVRDLGIDIVISDNRFGLWTRHAHTVYITHQVMIKAPAGYRWAEGLLHRLHRWIIRRYDVLWVPDNPGAQNLSGDLSHKYPLPANGAYTGILSRFGTAANPAPDKKRHKPDLLVILSGPEPQRTILEEKVLRNINEEKITGVVMLRGLPGSAGHPQQMPGVVIHDHLPDDDLRELITGARVIVCRPGYSGLMDLVSLGRPAVLVPTPGQTEQEYLADYLSASGSFQQLDQEGFTVRKALHAALALPERIDFTNQAHLLFRQLDCLPGRKTGV